MSAGGGERGPHSRFSRAGWIVCPACQTENRAGSRFCERCGTKLPRPGEAAGREGLAPAPAAVAADDSPPEQPPDVVVPGTALLFRPEEDAPPATPTAPLPSPRDAAPVPVARPPLVATPAGAPAAATGQGPRTSAAGGSATPTTTLVDATQRTRWVVAAIALSLLLICSMLGVLLVFLGAIDLPPHAPAIATIAATPGR